MRKHSGMRPQDIVVLLDIISRGESPWMMKAIAQEINLCPSEVTESLNRSYSARLLDRTKRKVKRQALLEFLRHGLRYVFPVHPGAIVRGIPTAFSIHPLEGYNLRDETLVCPHTKGTKRGHAIEPLYPALVEAALQKPALYELLGLVEALRIGQERELYLAEMELEKRILGEKS